MKENQQKHKHVRKGGSKAEVNDDRVVASIACWSKFDWLWLSNYGHIWIIQTKLGFAMFLRLLKYREIKFLHIWQKSTQMVLQLLTPNPLR